MTSLFPVLQPAPLPFPFFKEQGKQKTAVQVRERVVKVQIVLNKVFSDGDGQHMWGVIGKPEERILWVGLHTRSFALETNCPAHFVLSFSPLGSNFQKLE